ncbi:hypothetical protein [Actinomadura oligospora]|uniref:hypothetical protein n=1 Tax=Actinomadura oligospora TaxID=111804 RepID=UPI00047C02A2|nr:hypothetical protein [Actinomadura oligospora]
MQLTGWAAGLLPGLAFTGSAIVAAAACARPFTGPPNRAVGRSVAVAASVAVPCALLGVRPPALAVLLIALTLLAALSLARTRWAALLGFPLVGTILTGIVVLPDVGVPAEPGVPLARVVVRDGGPVVVVPHRPGWNIVGVDARTTAVGVDHDHLIATEPVAGSDGRWANVPLPPGRGRLWVRTGTRTVSLPIDPGHGAPASASALGDAPECASAAVAALASGHAGRFGACPAAALRPEDAADLRAVVAFVATRRVPAITVVADGSARSRAAAQVVREAARAEHVTVAREPRADRPTFLVSGWATAYARLMDIARGRTPSQGSYLAPWLLASPLLTVPAGQLVPLRFTPEDPMPRRYEAALQRRYPGQPPTGTGYTAWLSALRVQPATAIRLYAATTVQVPGPVGHDHGDGGAWLPGGTITEVAGPLNNPA